MSTEWGIFNDESPDWTDSESIECGFYSYDEAVARLAEMRAEYGSDDDDNCVVHEIEEAEELEYDDTDTDNTKEEKE